MTSPGQVQSPTYSKSESIPMTVSDLASKDRVSSRTKVDAMITRTSRNLTLTARLKTRGPQASSNPLAMTPRGGQSRQFSPIVDTSPTTKSTSQCTLTPSPTPSMTRWTMHQSRERDQPQATLLLNPNRVRAT